jgi:hypothetical protein
MQPEQRVIRVDKPLSMDRQRLVNEFCRPLPRTNPRWTYEGQTVFIRANLVDPGLPATIGLRCKVPQAHGDCAYVENEDCEVGRLMFYDELRVEVTV